MKEGLHRVIDAFALLGFDLRRTANFTRELPFFVRSLLEYRKQEKTADEAFPSGRLFPCLEDRRSLSGFSTGHYFHQDLLVARRIFLNRPRLHLDVGSRVDGFVAHVASFRPIEVVDLRPLGQRIQNVTFRQIDMMAEIDQSFFDYCDSISSLHAIEHFGLGRYGDRIHYVGHLVGLDNIHRILKSGGKFYFSAPVGPQRTEFNAHRVFALRYLVNLFAGRYRIDSFSFVDDKGSLHEDVRLDGAGPEIDRNFGCHFGCGIFEMTKR